MSETEPSTIPIDKKLCEIYIEAINLYDTFAIRNDPTNSSEFQLDIKRCIGLFEDATRLVSLTGMFSKNENYAEISGGDIKFILLPYFLGQLTVKLTTGERLDIVHTAEIYYVDFLQRCCDYGFQEADKIKQIRKAAADTEAAKSNELIEHNQQLNELRQLTKMAEDRNTKLQRYKEKKALDEEIAKLKIILSRENEDDSTQKEYYVKLIRSSIWDAFDELSSLDTEKQMLNHMMKMRHENPNFEAERKLKHPPKPLKPIIITRDAVQKAIYGAGYPSLPTMTVAEFYDERVAAGIFPDSSQGGYDNSLQNRLNMDTREHEDVEDEERERFEEIDDEQLIARNRAMDDWKDDHRRGEGNRHNRS